MTDTVENPMSLKVRERRERLVHLEREQWIALYLLRRRALDFARGLGPFFEEPTFTPGPDNLNRLTVFIAGLEEPATGGLLDVEMVPHAGEIAADFGFNVREFTVTRHMLIYTAWAPTRETVAEIED